MDLFSEKTVLVTGGGGYLGRNLIAALQSRGCTVRGLDIVSAPIDAPAAVAGPPVDWAKVDWVRGDIRDARVTERACADVDWVFHTAAMIELSTWYPKSFGAHVRSVNVGGTETLLAMAHAAGATRLVHTSSTAAVFGQETNGGDESGPYTTRTDLYSSTKAQSERLVLAADTVGGLRTCAIRPGGIYGPGERGTIIGPLVQSLCAGQPLVTIGRRGVRLDYTYIVNLVEAQLLAAEHLVEGSVVCGQAYFVTDGSPIHTARFSKTLVEHMGVKVRHIHLSGRVARGIAAVMEVVFRTFGRPTPPLTMVAAEMCDTDNHFSIDKAARDFGYVPALETEEGLRHTAEDARNYYDSLRHSSAAVHATRPNG